MMPITAMELQEAYIRRVKRDAPIEVEHSYGPSSSGFCLEKIVLRKRLDKKVPINAIMYIGRQLHKDFKNIFKETKYATAHGDTWMKRLTNWKNRPRFEKYFEYRDPKGRGFIIRGFIDADVPAVDCIIEYKSTGRDSPYEQGDPVLDAYIMQANAYAYIMNRERFEIWIFYKAYEDPETESVFSIINGGVDRDLFEYFLDRVHAVDKALYEDDDVVGPEMGWECSRCHLVNDCPHRQNDVAAMKKLLPATKAEITNAGMGECFRRLKALGTIIYNRTSKKWEMN